MLQRDFARIKAPNSEARLDWWQALTKTVQGMVSAPGDPGTAPQAAAARALARGDVAAAASQLRRMPAPRPAAVTAWLAAADRLQAGQAALTVLETAAITLPIPATAPADGDAT
jgi:hypothetical protein